MVTRAEPLMPAVAKIPEVREPTGRIARAQVIAAWGIPATLIVFLALSNGGYGVVERSQIGIAMWWIVVGVTLISAFPSAGVSTGSRVAFALLAAFAAWNALSFIWTENAEHTAVEFGRVLTYLGCFAVAIGFQGRGHARHLLAGTAFGLTIICAIALLSRMEPNWFPARQTDQYLAIANINRRLAYPLNYSGGIATLVTMTLPLLVVFAWSARSVVVRVLSAAAVPMAAVALWLTGSGLLLAVSWVGLLVFFVLCRERLPKAVSLLAGLLGGAALSFAVVHLSALDQGLTDSQALSQGDQLLGLTVVAMFAAGAVHLGVLSFARRHPAPNWMSPSPAGRRRLQIGLAVIAVIAAATALGTGAIGRGLDRFESRDNVAVDAPRLTQITDLSSSGRYQQWQAALDAGRANPVTGIGPGNFEFWWARNGSYGGYVRDAHSLYLETFAELGAIGLLLLISFIAAIAVASIRVLRRTTHRERTMRAGAIGAAAAFLAAAGVDWMWELAVLPIAFLIVVAVAISPEPGRHPRERRTPVGFRVGAVVAALLAIVLIGKPLAVTRELAASEASVGVNDLLTAYGDARDAQDAEPFASGPRLQQALVLERAGQLDDAVIAAEEAVDRAPTDWRPRLILARMQAEAGATAEALDTYRQARALNPRSTVFTGG